MTEIQRGERGPTGDHGQDGIDGIDGKDGLTGKTGAAGKAPKLLAVVLVGLTLLLVLVTLFQVVRIDSFTSELRDSAVNGCERQNLVRERVNQNAEIIQDSLRSDIQVREEFVPESQPGQVIALEAAIARDKANLRKVENLELADCEGAYPK